MTRRTKPLIERLMEKVVEDGDCWIFTGATSAGYGKLARGRRGEGFVLAHRASYEFHVGTVPEGLMLDHLCRRTACVNPQHLDPVPNRVNVLRGRASGNGAHNRRKTHCPKGHAYDEANTRLTKAGSRYCATCRRKAVAA
jgi:hypothetical protein